MLDRMTKAEQREAAALLRRLADALAAGELDGDAAHFHALMGAAIAFEAEAEAEAENR